MKHPICFLLLNLQNDLCHPEGIYAKNGLLPKSIEEIISPIVKVVEFCDKIQVPILASVLTIITDLQGNAIGLGNTLKNRPFLEKEGFRENTWGHDLLEEIPKVDYKIKQWSMSPFYQTELDRHLFALKAEEIILSGFTTNSAVETCAREALGRGLKITTLTDCVASYSEALHEASLTNLRSFGEIKSSEEWMESFSAETSGLSS